MFIGHKCVISVGLLLALTACGGGEGEDEVIILPEPDITFIKLPEARGLMPSIAQSNGKFEGDHFSGSASCGSCHDDPATGADNILEIPGPTAESPPKDLSIATAWQTSIMANSTRDPYWHAVVAYELDRYPEALHEEINDTCTRCHAPMASELAKKEGTTYQLFDSGSLAEGNFVAGLYSGDETSEMFNHGMDGVGCALCHQIADDGNLGTDAGMTGGFYIAPTPADPSDRPAYGQYDDPDVVYMRQNAKFTPTYGAHISTSETCGSCHNLKTEPVTAAGARVANVDHFAEQMTYSEWRASDYQVGGSKEANCQSCHMPKVDQALRIANANADIARNDFAEHTFLGANTVMQSMFRDNAAALGVPPGLDWDTSIERNREFLKSAATVELLASQRTAGGIEFDVEVTNRTGHKLPSGYHSRRAYLHVLVTDQTGSVVYENGAIRADGSIPGVVEDANPLLHESHYDVITSATQVQVYQAVPANEAGKRVASLLEPTSYLKDNRLPPSGFDKTLVSEDIAVHGEALTDSDFNNGKDTVTYQVSLPDATGPFTVVVELRYQPLAYGHLRELFLVGDRVDQVDMFRTIYQNTTLRDELMAITSTVVE